MTVVHIAGARPNFPKLAPVWLACEARGIDQRLIHTGQHYDEAMSGSFFADLGIPLPGHNLEVGSGTHAEQTSAIMVALEREFVQDRPDVVVVYGDVNSTLAAALVCAKLHIPVAHVEAGLRSFDMEMPEEVNRRVTDALATLLLTTSPDACTNLGAEGADADAVRLVGNPMIDSLLRTLDHVDQAAVAELVSDLDSFALVTLHRPSNVDDPRDAARSVTMLREVSERLPVLLPLHPRGAASLNAAGLSDLANVRIIAPQPYRTFIGLTQDARVVVTDSGGLQEETTILNVPCLTVRTTTERPITITHGTNQLTSMDEVPARLDEILEGTWTPPRQRPPLWDGHAGERIADELLSLLDPA